ncbi:MAG TPA: outer membrane protein assembly factor BamD [Terriglobales bacterium]|nr:outer membrane protein assembly factor BamD [Terriglobales bacterium]
MIRRVLFIALLLGLVLQATSCFRKNKNVTNPIANVNSAQPDKVLFDRAMDAMQHNRFDVARLSLQTMINTYPDSEYVARAKLAVGDSWYAEGGSAGLAQAEIEYKDFITFFPNLPEAAEAQLKVANIHYRQMEKPDRDFTHAKRAEEEYKQLIQQFPDSKLVPEGKQRLREVQEVLAEREYRIGHFYYMKESWPAAIARFKSLTDTYPLYSGVDDALYLLGQAYEQEAARTRTAPNLNEAGRAKLVKGFDDQAAAAYDRILTRYPVMGRAKEARARLEALHRPIPKATPEAIALNKQEEDSRRDMGHFSRLMINFHRHPDVSHVSKVGEPTLVPPKETSATEVTLEAQRTLMGASAGGTSALTVQPVGAGGPSPAANQPVPHSANGDSSTPTANSSIPELRPVGDAALPVIQVPQPAPTQVNEAGESQSSSNTSSQQGASSSSAQGSNDAQSSSKKKKKRKLWPF